MTNASVECLSICLSASPHQGLLPYIGASKISAYLELSRDADKADLWCDSATGAEHLSVCITVGTVSHAGSGAIETWLLAMARPIPGHPLASFCAAAVGSTAFQQIDSMSHRGSQWRWRPRYKFLFLTLNHIFLFGIVCT